MPTPHQLWLTATQEALASQRRMIDAAVAQLTDDELRARPAPGVNSVAVILRHLAGNLRSRWTDFLTTDGEKPDRDREREFEDWPGDRASLLAHFDDGWKRIEAALASVTEDNVAATILIRGETHTLPQAVTRSLLHIAYHAGQILMIARAVHTGAWKWLTIAPGGSHQHNEQTWGTSASRGAGGTELR